MNEEAQLARKSATYYQPMVTLDMYKENMFNVIDVLSDEYQQLKELWWNELITKVKFVTKTNVYVMASAFVAREIARKTKSPPRFEPFVERYKRDVRIDGRNMDLIALDMYKYYRVIDS